MRKYLISLALIPLLASCSLTKNSPTDFTGMYREHISYNIENIRNIAKDFWYMESYRIDGVIRGALEMPGIFSGAIRSEYSAEAHHGDAANHLKNIEASYALLGNEAKLQANSIDIVTRASDFFVRYSGLTLSNIITPEGADILKKYETKWLSVTRQELPGWATEAESRENQIAEALARMTLTDIESYLRDYPLWKEEKDLWEKDGMHAYEVTLHKENIVALVKAFTKKATGKDMEQAEIASLEKDMSDVEARWTIAFAPGSPDVARYDIALSSRSDTGSTMKLALLEKKWSLTLTLGNNIGGGTLEYVGSDDLDTLKVTAKEWWADFATLDLKFTKKSSHLTRLDGTLSVPGQWLTVTLEHTNNEDRSFAWKLNAWIGNLTWKWKLDDERLAELAITGAMPWSSLSLDLKDTDGTLTGPLSIKSWDTPVIDAKVRLVLAKERFLLGLDIANPEDQSYQTHAEVEITGKRAPWDGSIETPSPTTPLSTLTSEIDAASQRTPSTGSTRLTPFSPLPQK